MVWQPGLLRTGANYKEKTRSPIFFHSVAPAQLRIQEWHAFAGGETEAKSSMNIIINFNAKFSMK